MKTKALYAGTFDPMTLGHLDIITRASKIFDEVVVGVTLNLEKKTMFSFEERKDLIKVCCKDLENVSAGECEGLMADYVNNNGFNVVIRGIRDVGDLPAEKQWTQLHRHLFNEDVEIVHILADAEYSFISSTMAKQVVSLGGDGTILVPPYVLDQMKGKLGK